MNLFLRKLILTLVFFLSIASVQGQTIVVGVADVSNDVFAFENNKIQKSFGSIFQCILDNSSMDYVFRVLPLARLISELESGRIDVAIPLGETDKRNEFGEFAVSIVEIPYILLILDKTLKQGDSIKGLEVITQRGSHFQEIAEGLGADVKLTNTYEGAINMVLANRVYAFIGPENMLPLADQSNMSNASIIQFGIYGVGFYVSNQSNYQSEIIENLEMGYDACTNP
ncbi:MAG: transporter substrate-binding domain-containing protein [Spirochaetaceae bacterium]|nr:transporter substrate-binding domain-containing protein [Spirochaetaceae bacterium]